MTVDKLLHPEVKKIFYNWLEKQGARENYKTTIQLIGTLHRDVYSLSQIINWSFTWDRSPLGHSYWRELNTEWKDYIMCYLRTHPKFRKWVRDNNIYMY
jgi:hypothetical protein